MTLASHADVQLGLPHAFLPHKRLLKRKTTSVKKLFAHCLKKPISFDLVCCAQPITCCELRMPYKVHPKLANIHDRKWLWGGTRGSPQERQRGRLVLTHAKTFLLPDMYEIQYNPNFSNPRFFEPPDNSHQLSLPLDLLHSITQFLPPISRTLDNSKPPQTRSNSRLPWVNLTLDNSKL